MSGPSGGLTPQRLFRAVAVAEAITWALLLLGMFLKYVTKTTEAGVSVFGPVHGVAFVAYVVTTVVVAVDQRWSPGRTVLGLLAAVPPFVSVLFDLVVERRGGFGRWRLRSEAPARALDAPVAWLTRHPGRGLGAGVLAVAVLTALALLLGPPVGG